MTLRGCSNRSISQRLGLHPRHRPRRRRRRRSLRAPERQPSRWIPHAHRESMVSASNAEDSISADRASRRATGRRPPAADRYLCPHEESNLDRKLRKLMFYPLNYGSDWSIVNAFCGYSKCSRKRIRPISQCGAFWYTCAHEGHLLRGPPKADAGGAISSSGRALPWHGRGERFESAMVHYFATQASLRSARTLPSKFALLSGMRSSPS